MQRLVPFAEGEMYHIYNRGTEKREIFMDDRDRKRFLMLLYLCNDAAPVHLSNVLSEYQSESMGIFSREKEAEPLVSIGAYCLMPNHFHLLVKEITENGTSRFMGKVGTAYSMYFNKKYERTGALFSGRFKTKHIDDQPYLNWLFCITSETYCSLL